MGCGTSKPEDGVAAARKVEMPLAIPDVTWEADPSWAEWLRFVEKQSIEAGLHEQFCTEFPNVMAKLVHSRLAKEYPDSEEAGLIKVSGDSGGFATRDGSPCQYPTTHIMTIDETASILLNTTYVIAAPLQPKGEKTTTADGESRFVPGAWLGSSEMFYVRSAMLTQVAIMKQMPTNVDHVVIDIYMGADKITCKFNTTKTDPTIIRVPSGLSKEFTSFNKWMTKQAKKHPHEVLGMFRPQMFNTTVRTRANGPEGSTVWDEGELPFSVDGTPYPFPTRLLVARAHDKMVNEVDAVHFRIKTKMSAPDDKPVVLLRNLEPSKDPGGVVAITLVVAISPDVTWPKIGLFSKLPAFKAAEQALLEHVKQMNRDGMVERCEAYVMMGADVSQHKFLANKFPFKAPEEKENLQPKPDATQSLEAAFHITLEEQPKHNLFDSESHFQAIKAHMQQRAKEDPERQRAIELMMAPNMAKMFLETNYPGCEISDEGEFPAILPDGKEMTICDTRLVVARDPKQEPKSIVAAIHVVPCPGGADSEPVLLSDKVWLDTREMKGAELALLGLLKKLHREGKVSEVDCMAQVIMAKDASIYKFVDGERFEDYDDERMEAFVWPGSA